MIANGSVKSEIFLVEITERWKLKIRDDLQKRSWIAQKICSTSKSPETIKFLVRFNVTRKIEWENCDYGNYMSHRAVSDPNETTKGNNLVSRILVII